MFYSNNFGKAKKKNFEAIYIGFNFPIVKKNQLKSPLLYLTEMFESDKPSDTQIEH